MEKWFKIRQDLASSQRILATNEYKSFVHVILGKADGI